jgi:hypothetical protein
MKTNVTLKLDADLLREALVVAADESRRRALARLRDGLARCVLVLVVVLSAARTVDAQAPLRGAVNRDPHLRIDSPRDGAVVAPGETLQVRVSSPDRTRFGGITIVMEDPFDIDQEATSLPARFAIKIPEDIAPGSYTVSALAGRANGELVVAAIEVDIERRDMPRALMPRDPRFPYPRVYLEQKGKSRQIELLADFGNAHLDVTNSSKLTYESSDTAVATVNTSGTITAVGGGRATVIVWYGSRAGGIKAEIPVEVRQDADTKSAR